MEENEILMQKEIEAQRRLPIAVKQDIGRKSLNNLITAITILVYFLITNILFFNIPQNIFLVIVKVMASISAIATIAAFEIGYRKKNDSLFLNGFEFFVFSVILLYLPYIYIYKDAIAKIFLMLTSVFFTVYYIIKIGVIYLKTKINHKNNLSDIRDLLKPEDKGYLHEESNKTLKIRREEEIRKDPERKLESRKEAIQREKTKQEIEKEKIAQMEKTLEKMKKFNERTKKAQAAKEEKEIEENKKVELKKETASATTVAKKKTTKKAATKTTTAKATTKKTETKKQEEKVIEEPEEAPKPKKRGRPKKVS